ncbi:uncharacterized protein EAF01_004294 [Botrytis porri]|uniref:uncharacterized protein n=1 Tax=Botrytis porri TaxID=87229 RepID=UPI001900BF80|nr:uncharacterized protein EAF01_004294 [Botrytis porri]KAF7908539.1 hypothetical protein EAF01_004294 [Botrytis porri]
MMLNYTNKSKTNIFFLAAASDLVGQLIAPSLAALLMAKSPWIPILLGISFLTLGSLLILFVPETLHMQHRRTNTSHPRNSLFATIKHKFSHTLRTLQSSLSILNSAPLVLLLITFIINPLTSQSVDISLRYISKPLPLSSSFKLLPVVPPRCRANHIISPHSLLSIKNHDHVFQNPLLEERPSPRSRLYSYSHTRFTLDRPSLNSSVSYPRDVIDRQHKGQLYVAVAVVETTGRLIAGPCFAQLYIVGLGLKGIWVGLPFFGLSLICGLGGVAIWTAGWVMSRRKWVWEDGEEGEQ